MSVVIAGEIEGRFREGFFSFGNRGVGRFFRVGLG